MENQHASIHEGIRFQLKCRPSVVSKRKKKTTEKNQLKVRLTTRVVQVCFADVEERVGQEQFPNQQHDQVGVVRAQVLEAPSNGPSIL